MHIVLTLWFKSLAEGIRKDNDFSMQMIRVFQQILVPPNQEVACIFCVVSADMSTLEGAQYLALIHKEVALGLLRHA